jgi:hypothetical protein
MIERDGEQGEVQLVTGLVFPRGGPLSGKRGSHASALGLAGTLAAALMAFLLAAGIAVEVAQAASSDATATRAYVEADYRLMNAAVRKIPDAEAAIQGVLRDVRNECPKAAGGSPQNPMSTQLSNEVIGAMVLAVVKRGLSLAKSFVGATQALHWSSRALTREVQEYVGHVRVLSKLAPPDLCADVRAWASSGFQRLAPATEAFDRVFMPNWVAAGNLPAGLSRFEPGPTGSLAQRASTLEGTFTEFETRQVVVWGDIMNALELWP